jgi:hypothetical protein
LRRRIVAEKYQTITSDLDIVHLWEAYIKLKEFVEGKAAEVDEEDGLGTIIRPRPLPKSVIEEVMRWPEYGLSNIR